MRKVLLLILVVLAFTKSFATHVAGGEIFYQYVGPGSTANTSVYKVTMRLLRECNSASQAQLNGENITIGIYNKSTLTLVSSVTLIQQFSGTAPSIQHTQGINPCLTPDPSVCYQVGIYSNNITVSNNAEGYILSWIRYTRTSLTNAVSNPTTTGATFITQIPGTNQLATGNNSSPQFVIKDTSVICKQTSFAIDFGATDSDGDSLAYKFSPAYDGSAETQSNAAGNPNPSPTTTLTLVGLAYQSSFSGTSPLGSEVFINPVTGVISGKAPAAGKYVICVTVEEWRNGVLINEHRKDFILTINDCSITAATLKPSYITCNGFTMSFQNESTASNISSYAWDFGETKYTTDTSSKPAPTYTYHDTGVYVMKLKVTSTGGCQDSATANVRVFPGFTPDFSFTGSCFLNPYVFKDLTVTQYGYVNSWSWSFGDPASGTADTTSIQNPSHTYSTIGNKTVTFIVGNSKGCIDTLTKTVLVNDKPSLTLPFHDTLICSIDTLPLIANTNGGIITWTPSSRIINASSATPSVYPTDTTVYHVTVNNNGCINQDSITVNVLPFITVDAGRDTGICKTDTIRLKPISYALSYRWVASTGVFVDSVKYPLIQPLITTKYYVTANLGKCQDHDSVLVKVAPYPAVTATGDATICFGNRTQLNANIIGSSFTWKPTNTLLNANTLNPVAGPGKTTQYILTVTDTVGCPKPVSDTITVKVIPPITVKAGKDTSIVANQPLQLHAVVTDTSGISFLWSPSTGLNNPNISYPIATLTAAVDSIRYVVKATLDSVGCYGTDDIWVKVFKTEPDIFVPSAFTPNKDGLNDIIKPIPVGITTLTYFRIYNRWGQLLYSTAEIGQGWDGNVNGTAQPPGTYVYTVQGIDYTGKTVFRKGTVVLIR